MQSVCRMSMGGDGPWVIAVIVVVAESFSTDNHVYNLAFVFLPFYTIFTTASAHYGFGQNVTDIMARDPDDLPFAILFEAIGQTFAVIGMAVAKWSLGLFLLRIVKERWHKIAIWISMGCLAGASISTCFVFWLQCTPPNIDDPLHAGACGIKRTLEVPELSSPNYSKDTVGLIVWSAAEIAVTMICIGIPVCRPLYKQYLDRWTSRDGSKYREHSAGGSHPLQTIGGSTLNPNTPDKNNSISEDYDKEEHERRIAVKGPFTKTRVYSKGIHRLRDDNQSDEEILGPDFRRAQQMDLHGQEGGIRVTYEVTTSRQGI
ncbi:integral membrane protein pth11 [Fusarium pseudoanthophilum]|uniref:Integral membrane protein pth11 n=1 Tax=Fusarium pseudoanthophilum TaxID=48495 RepID=A0A8H5KJI0_9HYPO|nr:integral membrane protein pth11 [Fusarium pseudoanthophilum]